MNSLLPLLIIVAGAAANAEKLKALIGFSKNVAVQAELHEITKMIQLDRLGGSELPKPETFGEYLKANMRTQKTKEGAVRDVSCDLYGTPYRLEITPSNQVRVVSAGPDGRFGTTDDLSSERSLH